MDAFARWLTRHPLAVVVANLAVTAVLGLYAVHIRIENSLESMLPAGDPKVAYYNTTRALFGSDDVGVIGVRADDVFASTGAAHVKQPAVDLMRRDIARFTPIALALMLLVLWLSFGTLRGIFLPVLAVAMALVWTLGVIVLTGKALTFGTSVLPPLLLVVGSSYAIHVMARYYEQVDAGAPPDEVVVRAFARVWLPLAISALTTVIGFGSLMVNRITAIWDLGLFAVIGVVCLTVTCLGFLPAALQLMPSRLRSARSGKISPTLAENLRRLGERVYAKRRHILWAGVAVSLLATLDKSPGTLKSVVTPDFRTASILVRTSLSGSRRVEETLDRIRLYVAEHFPADIAVNLTGTLVLLTGTASDIVAGQIKSLTLALGIIFLVMTAMFLSAKIGFFAILPNVVPIVIFFGVMGWLGIYLNLVTSLIAAIALGIAVDSTNNYMARFT